MWGGEEWIEGGVGEGWVWCGGGGCAGKGV